MKRILFITLLTFSLFIQNSYSQNFPDKRALKNVNKEYLQVLKLSPQQSKEFKEILIRYNNQFLLLLDEDGISSNSKEFNILLKNLDLEIYNLLSPSNFEKYKATKIIIEPYKKYKL